MLKLPHLLPFFVATHSVSCFQILELYHAIQLKQGIILTGMTGSGKSTCYNILAKVMICLVSRQQEQTPVEEGEISNETTLKKAHHAQKLKVCIVQSHYYGRLGDGQK